METISLTPDPEKSDENFKPWGDVTDTNKHNPNNFRYLVHGINPAATMLIGDQAHTLRRGSYAGQA